MAQLWGGRFTKETDELVYRFNASITFDRRLYPEDIRGSIAHVRMLGKQGVLSDAEETKMPCKELSETDPRAGGDGELEITEEYEDIHSFVEAQLIERLGAYRKETSHRKEPK